MKRFVFFLALVLAVLKSHAGPAPAIPTLTLAEAHGLALRNHPQIAAATDRALAAGQVVKETRSGLFPQANLYGTAVGADSSETRILAGGLNNPSIMDRAAGGISLNQLITDFGRTANLTAGSRYSARAEDQNATATRQQVLLDVDTSYFGTLQAQAVLNVTRQTLETRELLLDQVSVLASNKLKSDLDVSFAHVALEEGRLLEEKAQNDADASQAALSTALGFREFHRFQPVDESALGVDTNNIEALIDQALRERPELLRLRYESKAAERYARSQRDARYPTVAATGLFGDSPAHDNRLPDHYAAGGIQISVPLFAGGYYSSRQHEFELRAHAAEEMLRSQEDIVIRDVRIAWLNLNNAQQRLRTTAQLLTHANQAFELAQARYKSGSSSIVELSQAQLEITSAQIANASARYDVLIQEANLNYQTGGLSPP
ncbi:MAG TPA: TolC family protein [Verrucomicrobiae bacterium]|nr:TolC family protein [Verrucomicrobiae bacterium]